MYVGEVGDPLLVRRRCHERPAQDVGWTRAARLFAFRREADIAIAIERPREGRLVAGKLTIPNSIDRRQGGQAAFD